MQTDHNIAVQGTSFETRQQDINGRLLRLFLELVRDLAKADALSPTTAKYYQRAGDMLGNVIYAEQIQRHSEQRDFEENPPVMTTHNEGLS